MSDIKRKSGLSGDRAYKLQVQLKARLLDIISGAVSFKATHTYICEKVRNEVFSEGERRGAPQHVLSYLRGVYDTRMEDIYRYHMVWCMSVDGQLLTSEEMKALSLHELKLKKSKSLTYKSPWARCDNDKSVHVWKDHNGAVRKDKPYNFKAA